MTKKIKPSILPGFMELSPKEQLIFNDLVNKMTRVYEQNGCMPIDTPVIEKEEILLAKSAGETEKQVYRIDKEKNKQALRFDLTVPFARYVVQHMNDISFPFKRYQLGKVYRGERNQKGRYREFYQLDIDIINPLKLELTNDAFVISLSAKAFESIGLKDYTFLISNRKILSGLLDGLGIEQQQAVMGIIDKFEKIGQENCYQELEELVGGENAQSIMALLQVSGEPEIVLTQVKELGANYAKVMEGAAELEEVIATLKLLGVRDENFKIDLKIIRGLDYYTGTIFETIINGHENYGSICSGGRYDHLTQLYTDTQMPGVGISIGVTRLYFVLSEIGFLDSYKPKDSIKYLIAPLGNTLKETIQVGEYLQKKGIKSEVYLNQDNLRKQLKYANAKGIESVIIIGENEVANKELVIRNMKTGEQITVNQEDFFKLTVSTS